ncbi:hypothetical protein HJG60_011039 [Phyllostomus discolor]|uniref:Uncharacterized protein n=1 Tax=Phyllostomus discolor TaxID=89673 RepID=A0A834A857_9CHIR|nr:hypothetical protein HJG60_011039 [Phyllostomus discolor]
MSSPSWESIPVKGAPNHPLNSLGAQGGEHTQEGMNRSALGKSGRALGGSDIQQGLEVWVEMRRDRRMTAPDHQGPRGWLLRFLKGQAASGRARPGERRAALAFLPSPTPSPSTTAAFVSFPVWPPFPDHSRPPPQDAAPMDHGELTGTCESRGRRAAEGGRWLPCSPGSLGGNGLGAWPSWVSGEFIVVSFTS